MEGRCAAVFVIRLDRPSSSPDASEGGRNGTARQGEWSRKSRCPKTRQDKTRHVCCGVLSEVGEPLAIAIQGGRSEPKRTVSRRAELKAKNKNKKLTLMRCVYSSDYT